VCGSFARVLFNVLCSAQSKHNDSDTEQFSFFHLSPSVSSALLTLSSLVK
jgi:hypothetical protein